MSFNNPLTGAPYYDDYDPSKGYVSVAAIPGRVEQAREFIQAQTIMRDYLGRLGDALLTNGSIVSGCSLVVNRNTLTLTPGSIYLDGLIRQVDAQVLTITGAGYERVCAKIVQTIVTENEDSSLRDPAQNYENAGQAGAHRVKEVVVFSIANNSDTDKGCVIYTLFNGELLKAESQQDDQSLLYETLARRTYDENGSYKVEGLELVDRQDCSKDGILLSVSNGKAYVKGYEVTKTATSTITLDFCTTTRRMYGDSYYYEDPGDDASASTEPSWVLDFPPVKSILAVRCEIRADDEMHRSGTVTASDSFPDAHTPVKTIEHVYQLVNGERHEFPPEAYALDTKKSLKWKGSDQPALGYTYYATFIFNKTYNESLGGIGTVVELVNKYNSVTNSYESKMILHSDEVIVEDTYVQVDYEYYLARKDLVLLDHTGAFVIHKGTPDTVQNCESPLCQDPTKLIVGTVMVKPGYSSADADPYLRSIQVNTNKATRLSQLHLQNLKTRVDNLEYDIALTDLDEEAADNEQATLLKGIFTDGFLGVSKCDLGNASFKCSIDLDNQELTLPISSEIIRVIPNHTSTNTTTKKIGHVYMAPYEDVIAISQPYATEKMLVNPYAVYQPMALLSINPSVDNWIDTENIIVDNSKTSALTLRRWWLYRGEEWAETEKAKWVNLTGTTGESLNWGNNTTTSIVSESSSVLLDEAIMYMRQIEIEVSGSNYEANADNLICYFSDTQVSLTPTGTTTAGSFKVPEKIPCGNVNVVISNDSNKGTAVYQAQGRKQVISTTVLKETVAVSIYDPLAQAFQFDEDTLLTKVGLFFASKDAYKNVVVQIRNTVNGYPGTTVYDEVYVDAKDIEYSDDGSVETIVQFSQPVMARADTMYCITILSDSNNYSMWIATLGSQDVSTGNYVTNQPYTAGVLFSSSNAQTWTTHQASDLKFNLYKAQYTGDVGSIIFNDISGAQMNRILIAAQSLDYNNSGIQWYYRTSSGTSITDDDDDTSLLNSTVWMPIETYVDRQLNSVSSTLQLKVDITPESYMSPLLVGDAVNLVSFIEQTEGTYVSRTVFLDQPYDQVNISYEAAIPSGCSVRVMFTYDYVHWIEVPQSSDAVDVDYEFKRYTHLYENLEAPQTMYKVKIVMTTDNVVKRPRIRKLMNIMRNINSMDIGN